MQDSDAAAAGPRTLRRGLAVLAALRDQGPDGLSVTDIARLTGIQRPTIYRLLAARRPGAARDGHQEVPRPARGGPRYPLPRPARAPAAAGAATAGRPHRRRGVPGGARRGRFHQPAPRDRQLPRADPRHLRRQAPAAGRGIGRHGAPGRPARRGRARHRRAQFRPARRVRRHDAAGNVPIDREHPRARLFGGGQPRRARRAGRGLRAAGRAWRAAAGRQRHRDHRPHAGAAPARDRRLDQDRAGKAGGAG